MTTLVAPAGSKVLCPRGHHLCDLSHDLHLGDINFAMKFVNWRQPKPVVGDLKPIRCAKCGSAIFDQEGHHLVFRPAKAKTIPSGLFA